MVLGGSLEGVTRLALRRDAIENICAMPKKFRDRSRQPRGRTNASQLLMAATRQSGRIYGIEKLVRESARAPDPSKARNEIMRMIVGAGQHADAPN